MEYDSPTSNVLFGVFFLREQLHTYIDVVERQKGCLSRYIGPETVSQLLKSKRSLLGLSEDKFLELIKERVTETELFHPFQLTWLDKNELCSQQSRAGIMKQLQEFDKTAMKWCYAFIAAQNSDIKDTGFFLTIIRCAKADVDLLTFLN